MVHSYIYVYVCRLMEIFESKRAVQKGGTHFHRAVAGCRMSNRVCVDRNISDTGIGDASRIIKDEQHNKICVEKKNQKVATEWFIALIICSTCFGHFYAHHQELELYVCYYRL